MEYGSAATKLIKQVDPNCVDVIQQYEEKLVAEIKKESQTLFSENLRTSQTTDTEREEPRPGPSTTEDQEPAIPEDIYRDENEVVPEEVVDYKQADQVAMQARHTALAWNKRCLIAYHMHRLERLKQLRWDFGTNLPKEVVANLSKAELKWFMEYNDNLFMYMRSLNDGQGLDLTTYMTPPKRLFVNVECKEDYGHFEMEDGFSIKLMKGTTHSLPLSQCEKLIHQGVLIQKMV